MKYNKKKLFERVQAEMTFEELFEVFEKQRNILGMLREVAPSVYLPVVFKMVAPNASERSPAYENGVTKLAQIVRELATTSDLEEHLKPSQN